MSLELADFTPRMKVVVGVLPIFEVNHFGQLIEQQAERPTHVDHVNRHILTIQNQNTGV